MLNKPDKNFTVLENEWIELKDGRRLAARIWLPDVSEEKPVPAILEYLPYRKRDGTAARDATTYPVFAQHGYAGVRVDIAGNGESEGLLTDEYTEDELATGEEVVAWIAAQPWCSGAVGIIGISWGGFNGLQIAMRRPAALKAVVSVCTTSDRYADDIHYMGGCLLNDNMTWAQQMLAYSSRPPDPALVGEGWRDIWVERLKNLPNLAANWMSHQRRDAFWKHGSLCEDWQSITAPVLCIGGWADAYRNTAAAIAEKLEAPAKALMGPWDHKYPHIARVLPKADFHGEVLHWFDRWLKGEENGAENLPDYRVFVQDFQAPMVEFGERSGRWVAEQSWPSPNVAMQAFHLGTGTLGAQSEGEVVVSTPQDLGKASGNFCAGMRMANELPGDQRTDDALSVCFDSGPLEADVEIIGAPMIELDVVSDKPAAFLVGRLCEVAPDGTSILVSYRPFNLAHRISHEHPEALEPGERYRVRFPLNQCAHRFSKGSSIRLALSTSYWPMVWPSPEAAKVTVELRDSTLLLPVRKNAQPEDSTAAPEPARSYPVLAVEKLTDAHDSTERGVDADGRSFFETFDDFGWNSDLETGLATHSNVRQRFSVKPDDPLTAEAFAEWTMDLKRDGWEIRTNSHHRMTCDATHFHIEAGISTFENGKPVYEHYWNQKIPRDHI
ncbi:putative CocE/NonD family hydrolase [Mesorhizobium soli]|uniref:CocE/NonD family hydrolase n=1 Tax=Pseudaminobacter soli (ex Li et al. 2025) TaxID=1295366 RepID=UPI002473260F|nr:CocE/NonD family hydrolase [Mesorhizobium soli]MDH6232108.1 putative CocE/NonD family hydrolase [Mesorhizobium soli]